MSNRNQNKMLKSTTQARIAEYARATKTYIDRRPRLCKLSSIISSYEYERMVNKSVLTYSKNRRQFSYFKGWNLNRLLPRYDKKNINTMEIWSSRRFEIGEKKCQFSRVLNSLTGGMNFNATNKFMKSLRLIASLFHRLR